MTGEQQDGVSPYEQLRLLLLDDARSEDVGVAYGTARRFLPGKSRTEINEVVRQVLLELFDEGLIIFYRSDQTRGYGATRDQVEPLSRPEVVRALEEISVVPPTDQLLFFLQTPNGASLIEGLPPGTIPTLR